MPEGRYFRNPYHWGWEITRITDIPAGRLGVRTRLYGRDLPPGRIVADEDTKGILPEVLRPGKYRINPYAYAVELFDAISIRPGSVGVVTSLVGKDVLSDELPPEARNLFLVGPGMKGVVPEVLDPGTYYLNPYLVNVAEVNLQSQRFEMSGDDAITFLTLDGFTVRVEGTIEFAISRDKAALITHRVGDMEDVLKKIILPRARGFSRIEGSKHPAINFIIGETRQQFQDNLETHLRQQARGVGGECALGADPQHHAAGPDRQHHPRARGGGAGRAQVRAADRAGQVPGGAGAPGDAGRSRTRRRCRPTRPASARSSGPSRSRRCR